MHNVTLTVLVEPEFKRACRIAAAQNGVSLSDWVRAVLQQHVSFFDTNVLHDARNVAHETQQFPDDE